LIDEKPIGAALSRNLGGSPEAVELAEKGIDGFIEARDKQRRQTEDERAEAAAWRESERRVEAARREANRRERVECHFAQAERCRAVLASLVSYHEAEAEKYRAVGEVA
jgi:hypothetical protein